MESMVEELGKPVAPHPAHVSHGPVFIVVNPGSGRETREQKLGTLKAELDRSGRAGEVMVADEGEDIAHLAARAAQRAEREGGIVVVAGGDGTVSAVASAVVPRGIALGVVPEGTFNLLARNYGISEDSTEAIRIALTGQTMPVQVGRVNDLLFLVNASIGLYPKLLADREQFKSRFGRRRWVALLAGMKTLLGEFRPLTLDIELDGQRRKLQTPTLFIGNNRMQLERLGLPEAQATERGQLVLLTAPPFGFWTLLKLMLQAALGRLNQASEAEAVAFRVLEVARKPRSGSKRRQFGIALDGERARIESPARFSVEPRPLWLIVPMAIERSPEFEAATAIGDPGVTAPASGPALGGLAGA